MRYVALSTCALLGTTPFLKHVLVWVLGNAFINLLYDVLLTPDNYITFLHDTENWSFLKELLSLNGVMALTHIVRRGYLSRHQEMVELPCRNAMQRLPFLLSSKGILIVFVPLVSLLEAEIISATCNLTGIIATPTSEVIPARACPVNKFTVIFVHQVWKGASQAIFAGLNYIAAAKIRGIDVYAAERKNIEVVATKSDAEETTIDNS